MPVRILLAEDHALVRESLKTLLMSEGFEIVGEAAEGQETLRQIELQRPEIVVMDIGMPVLNGLEAAREISRSFPKVKTVLLTQHDGEHYLSNALDAGVKGYVLKSQAARDLVDAIRKVATGEMYLSPGIARSLVDVYRSASNKPANNLTPRERQVLQLIAEGKSTKDVATVLGISVKTAESHRTRLMAKLEIHEVASLVRYALRRGMTQP